MSRRSRRERRRLKKARKVEKKEEPKEIISEKEAHKDNFFKRKYKLLLLIPLFLLLFAIVQISIQTITTGDFVNKGVSLKGGVTITVPYEGEIDIFDLRAELVKDFPAFDLGVRSLTRAGTSIGFIVEADIKDSELVSSLIKKIEDDTDVKRNLYSIETIEPSLGKSFFRETFTAILFAFLFMGIVVFLYFRNIVPSGAVILAALSDMVITLAITNILGIKLTTASIAAFLMLIGYSVDTDILLSTRVLKREEGSVYERVIGAMKTGLTMTFSTMAALIIALIITDSLVLKQIMTILLIGLTVDIINTWLQNAGILRWYMERKNV